MSTSFNCKVYVALYMCAYLVKFTCLCVFACTDIMYICPCVVSHFILPSAVSLTFTKNNSTFNAYHIEFVVDPQFNIGNREVTEGGTLAVKLSADALTDSLLLTPGLNTSGFIEVDLILEQGTIEPFAQFGMLTANTSHL